jgi:hypothetical protein
MTLRDARLGWGGASSVYRRLTVSESLSAKYIGLTICEAPVRHLHC